MKNVGFYGSAFGAAAAWVFLAHPPPGLLWMDNSWVTQQMLAAATPLDAVRFFADYHTYARPVRALEWWVAARLLGDDPLAHHLVNGLAVAVALTTVVAIGTRLTGRRRCGLIAGMFMAVSYVTAYPLLHFPFAVQLALALAGLASYLRAEGAGAPRWGWHAVAFPAILAAALAHDVFLAFAVVPLLYGLIVSRAAVWRPLVYLAIIPLYRLLQSGRSALPGFSGLLVPEEPWEHIGRVAFHLATAGLPAEVLREPLLYGGAEFVRLRQLLLGPSGFLVVALSIVPLSIALIVALRPPVDRQTVFCLAWLAAASLPLLLPVGTPETYHLAGALPALFIVLARGLVRLPGRPSLVIVSALLAIWAGVHGVLRFTLFHRDVPYMAAATQTLRRVLAEPGGRVVVLFPVGQAGPHYGYMPGPNAIRRGSACFLEPVWAWDPRVPPPLPQACRRRDGVLVGPLEPDTERELSRSRRMWSHKAAGGMRQLESSSDIRHGHPGDYLRLCPNVEVETVELRPRGSRHWLYTMPLGEDTRVFRFSLDGRPSLVAAPACGN